DDRKRGSNRDRGVEGIAARIQDFASSLGGEHMGGGNAALLCRGGRRLDIADEQKAADQESRCGTHEGKSHLRHCMKMRLQAFCIVRHVTQPASSRGTMRRTGRARTTA